MGTDPSRVRMSGPLMPFAAGFAGKLAGRGYSPGVVAIHLRVMADLSRWLEPWGCAAADLVRSVAGEFRWPGRRAAYRRGCRPIGRWTRCSGYLRSAVRRGSRGRPVPAVTPQRMLLLGAVPHHLVAGTGSAAVHDRADDGHVAARSWWPGLRDGRPDWERLTPGEVRRRSSEAVPQPGGVPRMSDSRLRLSWVRPCERADRRSAAGPTRSRGPRSRRLARCPRRSTRRRVAALARVRSAHAWLAGGTSPCAGHAGRLGLRAGEVAALRLDDIDWRRGRDRGPRQGPHARPAAAARRCRGEDRGLPARRPAQHAGAGRCSSARGRRTGRSPGGSRRRGGRRPPGRARARSTPTGCGTRRRRRCCGRGGRCARSATSCGIAAP